MVFETRPVELWLVNLNAAREIAIAPDEQQRAARFRKAEDGIRWARSRTALRSILSSYLDCGPLDFHFAYGRHGKPSVAGGLEFNLSHSGEWAMIAVARDAPVGVDIERFRPGVDVRKLLGRLHETDLPESPTDLYQRWTRHEAAAKTVGISLFHPVDPLVLTADINAPAGYAAAVGMLGFEPQPVYCGMR